MTVVLLDRRSVLRAALPAALFAVALTAPAAAQSSLQVPLQFDFINPGAKNLALGGAFVGMADDATAAFANPAGLTQLGASELSVELRTTRTETPFLQSGRVSGAITGFGADTVPGPIFAQLLNTRTAVGFGAGVYVAPSKRWVIAAFRHELVNVRQSYTTAGVFIRFPDELTSRRELPQIGDRGLVITGYGGSGSYKLTPSIAIGGGITAYRFRIDSRFRRYDVGGFGAPNYNLELFRSAQSGDDVSMAPTIGVLLGQDVPDQRIPLWRRTRVGIVYRRGATFAYDSISSNFFTDITTTTPQRFRVPGTVAIGASVRLRPQWTMAGEVTRISYSRLRLDYVTDQARGAEQPTAFTIGDGTEVHIGSQYAFTRFRLIPRLRLGAWFDPDHSVRYTPSQPSVTASGRVTDAVMAAALSQGNDQIHVTAGVGLTLHRRAELNVGADMTTSQFRWSTSLIVR